MTNGNAIEPATTDSKIDVENTNEQSDEEDRKDKEMYEKMDKEELVKAHRQLKVILAKQETFDPSLYATKKTYAQGFMDLSLFAANAYEFRAAVEDGPERYKFYYPLIVLISVSFFLQLMVAALLIALARIKINASNPLLQKTIITRKDMEEEKEKYRDTVKTTQRLNDSVLALILLITILGILILAFGSRQFTSIKTITS